MLLLKLMKSDISLTFCFKVAALKTAHKFDLQCFVRTLQTGRK